MRAVSTPITPMSRRRTLDHRWPRSLSSGMVITSQLTAAPARLMERRILTLSVMVNHVHQEVRWVDLCELQLVANLRRDMGKGGPFPMPIVGRRCVATKLLKQQPAVRVLRVLGDEGQAAQPATCLAPPLIGAEVDDQIDAAGHHLPHDHGREVWVSRHGKGFEPLEGGPRPTGMQRCQASVVSTRHGVEHVQGLLPANLSDDNPAGTLTQSAALKQVLKSDPTGSLHIGVPLLKAEEVRLSELVQAH